MQEQWTRWEPIAGLSQKYYIESISDTIEGFKILLFDANDREKKILVSFPNSVDAYRSTDESYILLTVSNLDKVYGDKFYGEWTFFKIKNSEYLKWISVQSYSSSDFFNFTHFCFLATDSVVDVVTNYEPVVTHISGKSENNPQQ